MSLLTCLLAGCAVGPDFKPPPAPDVDRYTPTPVSVTSGTPNVVGGEPQRFSNGIDISGEWWTLFHSRPLNALIDRALRNNPDLKAAQAALRVARENVLAQKGAYYPSISGSVNVTRQKTSSPDAGAMHLNLYTPQVSVSYVPDVFGLNGRAVESLQAQAEQAHFALAAAHLALSANVAAASVQEASLREQIAATRELIAINTSMLQVLRDQFAKGYVSRLDVASQESQLAQVSATLPPLLKQLAQQRDLLAALSGGYPSQVLAEEFELAGLTLPEALPLSLPAQLVAQRPDVRQAEENLHAAGAQIGIAVANRLPNLTLTANAGNMAQVASEIFAGSTGFWSLGATLTQPIFQGGTLLHRERAARAAYEQVAEQYRSTVLVAFQNVADTLHAIEHDADALKAAAAAKDAASVRLELAKRQWKTGYTNFLTLLNAEQNYQQAVISLIQAQANRYADTVALFQALGGGWWNRPEIAKN